MTNDAKNELVYKMTFSSVYPALVVKAEPKRKSTT
jgi:hypothetical protein